jgi:FtsP/CotA-like multicopper oxidase with cupredoxin domain
LATRTLRSTARRWESRRFLLLAGVLALATVASLALTRSSGLAISGGDPYTVPLVTDSNPDPDIVSTTLVAEEASVDIGNGITAHAQTFNGQIPGPTFRLKVGDTVIVRYENHLTRESGIHWHGIELANEMDGTPFTMNQVEPGGSFLYKFTVTRPGIFWYHPHHHASTNQVFKGLYGMVIVEDPNENQLQASGTLPSDAQTKPIVLSDTTVCKAPGTNPTHAYNDNGDSTPLTTAPWSGSGGVPNSLPPQLDPSPKNLCEGPGVNSGGDLDPYPINEDGVARGPFAAGDIPNIQTFDHAGRTNEGVTVLTNGKNVGSRGGGPTADGYVPAASPAAGASLLNVRPGQGLRLQLLNASNVRYFRLHLTAPNGTQIPLRRVGGEGGLLNNAVTDGGTQGAWVTKFTSGEILLPPGTRADVVAAIPSAPTSGVLTLWTRDYSRTGMSFSNIATVPVMHLNLSGSPVSPAYTIPNNTPLRAATGDPVESLGPATGNLLTPAGGFVPPKQGTNNQNITLTQAATEAGINGVFGTHDVPGDYKNADHLNSTRYAEQGDILQLTATNSTGAHHPFHLHGFSIQPLLLDGPAATDFTWPYPEFRDNIDIPNGYTLTFRVRLDPRPKVDGTTPGGALGRWVFHCHIFFHASNGMLSELVVTSPNGNERPDINVNNSFITVPRGQTATVNGTYGDQEGNPVTLSASEGTVTNNGGGTFTWRLRNPRGGNRLIYINATDSNGLKGQIPLNMNKFPELTRLRVVPKHFKVGGGLTRRTGTVAKRKKGAKIRFGLSEAAKVKFTVRRLVRGKPRGKATKFSRTFKAQGKKKVKFTGHFRGGNLTPGDYVLKAVAIDNTNLRSRKYSKKFSVVP